MSIYTLIDGTSRRPPRQLKSGSNTALAFRYPQFLFPVKNRPDLRPGRGPFQLQPAGPLPPLLPPALA